MKKKKKKTGKHKSNSPNAMVDRRKRRGKNSVSGNNHKNGCLARQYLLRARLLPQLHLLRYRLLRLRRRKLEALVTRSAKTGWRICALPWQGHGHIRAYRWNTAEGLAFHTTDTKVTTVHYAFRGDTLQP